MTTAAIANKYASSRLGAAKPPQLPQTSPAEPASRGILTGSLGELAFGAFPSSFC